MTDPYRHVRTDRVLAELCSRLSDQCAETGREDLCEVISFLAEIARHHPGVVKAARGRLLECIRADDQLQEVAGLIREDWERQRALAEMETEGGLQ